MKKFFILFAVLFTFVFNVNAQKTDSTKKSNPVELKAGLIFLPCAGVSLFSFEKMFTGITPDVPLYTVVSLKKGPVSLNPYFVMSKTATSVNNSFGVFVEYFLYDKNKKTSAVLFGVVKKDTKTSATDIGAGTFIPFVKGQGTSLLLEFKTPTDKLNPSFVVGVLMPFMYKIK